MEKFKQEDKDITLKVEIEGGKVKPSLVNFFLPGCWNGPNLEMDEMPLHGLDFDLENAAEEEVKKFFWEISVFNTVEHFRGQAEKCEDKDIAEGFIAVAEAVERVDMNQVKLQVIRK